jgi:hypothetical protein
MSRSLGIISGAFALRSRSFALVGHVVFYFAGRHFGSISSHLDTTRVSADR